MEVKVRNVSCICYYLQIYVTQLDNDNKYLVITNLNSKRPY